MTFKRKISFHQFVFERIMKDPTTEQIDEDSYRVYMNRKWIETLLELTQDPERTFLFKVDGVGYYNRHGSNYVEVTLLDGAQEYMDMIAL